MTPLEIADDLRTDILSGRLGPGADLHQAQLAERFGVSRIPVRDALNLLAQQRLVRVRPHRGAQVVQLNVDEVREVYDLRILLETDCLRRAVDRCRPSDVEVMTHEARRCEVDAGRPDFHCADDRFHRALYRPAGRPRQMALIAELRLVCCLHVAVHDRLRQSEDRWSRDHRRILTAVRRNRSDNATEALRRHLQTAAAALLKEMKG